MEVRPLRRCWCSCHAGYAKLEKPPIPYGKQFCGPCEVDRDLSKSMLFADYVLRVEGCV